LSGQMRRSHQLVQQVLQEVQHQVEQVPRVRQEGLTFVRYCPS
jgi:hypothetical protein